MLRPAVAGGLIAVVVCGLVGGIHSLDFLDEVDLAGYDLLVYFRGPAATHDALVFVDFDDATTQEIGRFPVPRGVLAETLDAISAGQPEVIGLDFILDHAREPREEDQRLAAAVERAGNVILASNLESLQLKASEPLPEFARHALEIGFVNLQYDSDRVVRRMYLAARGRAISFPAALATNFLAVPLRPGPPGRYRLGAAEIHLSGEDPKLAIIGSWSPSPARVVSARRLRQPSFDAGVFKKKIVIVGQSSSAGQDLHDSPVFRFRRLDRLLGLWGAGEGRWRLSGPEIHATAVASLLTGETTRVLGSAPLWAFNLVLTWGVIVIVLNARPFPATTLALLAGAGTALMAGFLFATHLVWMRFVSTELALLLALPAAFAHGLLRERRAKAALMDLFGRYVSPEVAEEIWRRREEIVLAGEERVATVLFSDIRGFTNLTAGKPSAEVLAWLNEYLTAMSAVVKKHGGFLNKFMGDGMMVVFGVPLSKGAEADARRAVEAALEMLERLKDLNSRNDGIQPSLRIGIGIHTGPLTAGNVGSPDRLEYSVIGETVNMASRLEGESKKFPGTSIVMSERTHELVEGPLETLRLGETEIRGFEGKTPVYTVRRQATGEAP